MLDVFELLAEHYVKSLNEVRSCIKAAEASPPTYEYKSGVMSRLGKRTCRAFMHMFYARSCWRVLSEIYERRRTAFFWAKS